SRLEIVARNGCRSSLGGNPVARASYEVYRVERRTVSRRERLVVRVTRADAGPASRRARPKTWVRVGYGLRRGAFGPGRPWLVHAGSWYTVHSSQRIRSASEQTLGSSGRGSPNPRS